MEDDLDAQLEHQMNKVWRLHTEKAWREQKAREKAEREAREKPECEVKERAKQEAQEIEWQDMEFHAKYAEEQRWKHEAVAQRVAEAKMLQHQVCWVHICIIPSMQV